MTHNNDDSAECAACIAGYADPAMDNEVLGLEHRMSTGPSWRYHIYSDATELYNQMVRNQYELAKLRVRVEQLEARIVKEDIVKKDIEEETDEESRYCPVCEDYMLTIDDYCLDCGADT